MIIRKPIWVSGRLREQKRSNVLVGIGRQKHNVCGLEVLLPIFQIMDSACPAVLIDPDGRDAGFSDDFEASRRLCLGNRGHRGRTLRPDVASTSGTIAVVDAGRAALIRLARNGRRPGKWMPTQHPGCPRHSFRESGATKWRHRILAHAPSLEDVATLVDRAVDVSRLARNTDFALDLVVVRFKLVIIERPIFDSRTFGNTRSAISPRRLADDFEVPRVEPPTLSPVVDRRATYRVHHGMIGEPWSIRR